MENVIIVFIGIVILLSYLYIKSLYVKKALTSDLKHQKALVRVLRYRLGDRMNSTVKFNLDELKEIYLWSEKQINDIYEKSKDYRNGIFKN